MGLSKTEPAVYTAASAPETQTETSLVEDLYGLGSGKPLKPIATGVA
jgi:hypothetical protein